MELWMKIAMIVVAVMSVLGLTAFIIVLHHVIPRRYYDGYFKRESKKNKFVEKIDAELGEFNRIVSFTESRLDHVVENVEKISVQLDELHRSVEGLDERLDCAHNDIRLCHERAFDACAETSALKTSLVSIRSVDLKKLKKRIKALEKEKE